MSECNCDQNHTAHENNPNGHRVDCPLWGPPDWVSECAACGEPVSYKDEGGCVGTEPNAYHFKAECLLEAARRESSRADLAEMRAGQLELQLERVNTERMELKQRLNK